MIVFDLVCGHGHVFEAWFGSHADYDSQRGRGLVACPSCGDGMVGKAPMAPRIATGAEPSPGRRLAAPDARSGGADMLRALMAEQGRLLARSEDVGAGFAEEARAIHAGEAEERPIHGQASQAEARQLIAEGVPVVPLLVPVRGPARSH